MEIGRHFRNSTQEYQREINELEADGKDENVKRFLRNLRWVILQISPVY